MSEREWTNVAISACLEKAFAGEWGAEPAPANAVVLRATDIDNDGHVVGVGAPRAIPKGKLSAKQMIDGDILLEGSGGSPDNPVGRVALFETADHVQPTICSNFFKTLRPNRQLINERFLWRKLCWFYRQPALLSMQQQTTGIINLKFQDYLAAEITLPADKAEQAKIAEVLDTLDTTIRQTEAFIEKLKQVKQGLLHDLLTRGIDANGELRPPQSEAPHLYKASPLGWIPVEWDADQIRHVSTLVTSGSRGWADHYAEAGALFLRSQNVRMGYLDLSDRQHVVPPSGAEGERTRLNAGDLLITITGNGVGNVASVNSNWTELAFVSQHVGLVRLVDPRLSQLAMHYLAPGAPGNQQLIDAQYGQSKPGLSLDGLRGLWIPIPSSEEQEQIIDRIMSAQNRIEIEGSYARQMRDLKSGLMDDLLTGRVRVTPLIPRGRSNG